MVNIDVGDKLRDMRWFVFGKPIYFTVNPKHALIISTYIATKGDAVGFDHVCLPAVFCSGVSSLCVQ